MKAMILAAGYGTRLKPITDNKPKALVEVQGAPLLQHAINNLKKHGFKDIIINVHHFANQILNFLEANNNFGINIQISDETELLLDTGGGIKKAQKYFNNEPFLVYNVDILTNIDINKLIEQHKKSNALATLAVKERETTRQILFDDENNLCEWRNIVTGEVKTCRKPIGQLKPLGFNCIHVINPEIFELFIEEGAFSIMDFYLRIAKTHNIKAFITNDAEWYDIGRFSNIHEVNSKHLNFI